MITSTNLSRESGTRPFERDVSENLLSALGKSSSSFAPVKDTQLGFGVTRRLGFAEESRVGSKNALDSISKSPRIALPAMLRLQHLPHLLPFGSTIAPACFAFEFLHILDETEGCLHSALTGLVFGDGFNFRFTLHFAFMA